MKTIRIERRTAWAQIRSALDEAVAAEYSVRSVLLDHYASSMLDMLFEVAYASTQPIYTVTDQHDDNIIVTTDFDRAWRVYDGGRWAWVMQAWTQEGVLLRETTIDGADNNHWIDYENRRTHVEEETEAGEGPAAGA